MTPFRFCLFLAMALAGPPVLVWGQSGQPSGQRAESGSLPVWTKPSLEAKQNLGKAARDVGRGVFLVGYPKVGYGTAWVVSKKHRLLVTNAHVADIRHLAGGKMLAIPSGSSQVFEVEKVWYHPGVRRYLKESPDSSVRSTHPREGEVDPASPDLAILQLSAEGPDLAVEWEMATPGELEELFAQPAGLTGFPGHDTAAWPGLGEKTAATYHDGVISRLTDFRFSPNAPPAELQMVQYTMASWSGFSGSPVFLPNGRVVAVHNMARTVKGKSGEIRSIPHGIRVDGVWEMLVFHDLTDRVTARFDKNKLLVDRWRNPDPRDEQLRKKVTRAATLVAEASHLIYVKEQFKEGVEKCNEAIELMPNFALAYYVRSHGFVNFWFNNRRRLSAEDGMKLLRAAAVSADKYVELAPSDPDGDILVCLILNNIGHSTEDYTFNRKALDRLNKLLTSDNLPNYTRAEAHSNRAIALDNLGNKDAALKEHNEAIRLNPNNPQLWENRADFWHYLGRPDLEAADYAKAREIREKLARKK